MVKPIGRCTIELSDARERMMNLVVSENTTEGKRPIWTDIVYPLYHNSEDGSWWSHVYDETFRRANTYWGPAGGDTVERLKSSFAARWDEWVRQIADRQLVVKCYYLDDNIAVVGFSASSNTCWILPSDCVNVSEYIDYTALTGPERHRLMQAGADADTDRTALSVYRSKSYQSLSNDIDDRKSSIDKLKSELEDVKQAKVDGLRELQEEIEKKQAELEAKKASWLEALNKKRSQMEAELEKMELTLYQLESEIYAIRCYMGEVVEVKQIRKGAPAPIDTPIVFYQKMRYMDEELGKLAGLYNVDFDDAHYLEQLLYSNRTCFESFTPTERSIVLVRVSRNNRSWGHVDGKDILVDFDKYHGEAVAVLIRDGENLYIAWTDDERIKFTDSAFYRPGQSEVSADSSVLEQGKYESDEVYEKRVKEYRKKEAAAQLGRYFVFTLLKGMLDRQLVVLPEDAFTSQPQDGVLSILNNHYIVLSYAEGYIGTNKYGTFGDMIEKANSSFKEGDMILTVDSIRPQRRTGYHGQYVDQAYHNDRGRGEKNRTHDVAASNNTVYPINMIEHLATYEYYYYYNSTPDETHHSTEIMTDAEYREFTTRSYAGYSWRYTHLTKVKDSDVYKMYISLEKDENWQTGKSARANFEIYSDEVINLTYMNSVWLKYVLANEKVHTLRIHGADVDFAHLIPYIQTAIRHCTKRENEIAGWISQCDSTFISEHPEWPVELSEWMLKQSIHNFSAFRTKQFINYTKEQMK